jgi:hypothetical protein
MRQSRTSLVFFAVAIVTGTLMAASRPPQIVVHGVELAIAPPATGAPAAIASAKSSATEGAYATAVVRNHASTPIRSVVIAATVRSGGDTAAPPRTFASPRLVTWIPPGESQMLQPRLIDPATLKVLGTQGARVVASVTRVEFSDGTVWPPDEPRQQAPETDAEKQFRAGAYSAGALPPGGIPPVVVRHVQPKYTTAAMRAKVEGPRRRARMALPSGNGERHTGVELRHDRARIPALSARHRARRSPRRPIQRSIRDGLWRGVGRAAGPNSTRPGRADVIAPFSKTTCPFTMTTENPSAYWCGDWNVARSRTRSGSKIAMSAFIPGRSTPRSCSPTRAAGSDVIFRTASSSVRTRFSRT